MTAAPARVVSLVPSVTETLVAWGVRPVGVTRFCEQPDLPAVGGTKDPDVARIVALAPDLVVVDREENRAEDAEALGSAGVDVHVLHVRDVGDVGPSLAGLRLAVGLAPRQSDGDGRLPEATPPLGGARVWVPIWRRPWMTLGAPTYASSLLGALGLVNVAAGLEATYPTVGPAEVAASAPDVVLAPSEPYPFKERHRAELAAVAPVRFVDGKDLFWWGTRTPAAYHRLAEALRDLTGR